MKYRLIHAEKAHHDVSLLARVLGVSPQGYYAWTRRGPSARARRDAELTKAIREHHQRSQGTYGAPRIHADLREDGQRLGRKRVARLMRRAGIRGVTRRKGTVTTVVDRRAFAAPDLVRRTFSAPAPNRIWTADITYIPTWEGFLYLAVVLDVFSRRIIGWAMADHLRTELVTDALAMAIDRRHPAPGVIHHSDSEYVGAGAFGRPDPHSDGRARMLVPASSGKTERHRLNRGGDRAANSALHMAVISRMRVDQRTKDYIARRTTEGRSKLEIMRCLKRYLAREIYYLIKNSKLTEALA